MTYLSDKYLIRSIDYNRAPVGPRALIVIRYNSGFTLAYDDGRPDLCGIRENASETSRQAWVDQAKAQGLAVLTMNAPAAEIGADGKPQLVLPGAERISLADVAKRRALAPLKPKTVQRPCDAGLFSDSANQQEMKL